MKIEHYSYSSFRLTMLNDSSDRWVFNATKDCSEPRLSSEYEVLFNEMYREMPL